MFCAYTRLKYQVSVYMTIGPLVICKWVQGTFTTCICYLVLQHLKLIKRRQHKLFFFLKKKIVTSLANIFTMENLVVKIIFGSKSFIFVNQFSIFCGFFTIF